MIPIAITRWKIVPSYTPSRALVMKCATWLGAASASRSSTIVPELVSITACLFCSSAAGSVEVKKVCACTRPNSIRATSIRAL